MTIAKISTNNKSLILISQIVGDHVGVVFTKTKDNRDKIIVIYCLVVMNQKPPITKEFGVSS